MGFDTFVMTLGVSSIYSYHITMICTINYQEDCQLYYLSPTQNSYSHDIRDIHIDIHHYEKNRCTRPGINVYIKLWKITMFPWVNQLFLWLFSKTQHTVGLPEGRNPISKSHDHPAIEAICFRCFSHLNPEITIFHRFWVEFPIY